jgi:hypothetical protein
MTAARTLGLALLGVTWAAAAGAQPAPEASVQGSGIVRVCDLDGSNLDSAGDQYYATGNDFLAGPTSGFRTSFSCIGQTQSYAAFTTASCWDSGWCRRCPSQ